LINEDIFKELYEDARIKKLTDEEMEAYKQSVLEYGDLISVADWAEEKGREKGRKEGREEGREEERINIVKDCYKRNMSIKDIAGFLNLTEEQVYNMLDS
jgi:predicted transposase/invertase (TIGR01784 family)